MYSLDEVKKVDPEVAQAIIDEENRQNSHFALIASENWVSKAVMAAMGSPLTNKYAEGYPGKRYYGGCECVDVIENLAIERAKKLFGCDYANVQPHSGAQANMAVQFAVLKPGDTIMGMNLDHGGHLTHGSPVNMSGKYFHVVPYGVDDNGFLDYDRMRELALECKPKMIIAGASAYARTNDFKKFREVADEEGAVLMVDMAHIAGLVAAGLHPSPIPYADVVTTTTHKTLRGPRGGMILCNKEANEKFNFNKAIFPGIQGGPLMEAPTELAPTAMGELVDSIAEYNNSANAIGFSVYYYIDQMYSKPGLRLLAVDGVTPSNETIADQSYPLCNEFYAAILQDSAADSPERRIYEWLSTDAGRSCIEHSGYVSVQ